jgi:hypothetical protein
MTIRDENSLLSEEERQSYHHLLTLHCHEPHHFFLEVMEDQAPLDMNDMSYVIIIKTTATHLKHEKSKTYVSRAGSGTWLAEFEEDLKRGYFLRG